MKKLHTNAINHLKSLQNPTGYFVGRLSDSAVSTSTAIVALYKKDPQKHKTIIQRAQNWLISTQLKDGGWGDSPESPPNVTASILAYAALHCAEKNEESIARAKYYLCQHLGGFSPEHIRAFLLKKYGSDLTFSVPILSLLTACDLLNDCTNPWSKIHQLPLEMAILPHQLLRFFKLHVVSYAIPALICIGIAQLKKRPQTLLSKIRQLFIPSTLKVLKTKQPHSGGFLEAAPLTSFCLICLCEAQLSNHEVAFNAERFLIQNICSTGAWPIDSNLWQWTTSLAARALQPHLNKSEKLKLSHLIASQQHKIPHPFTHTQPGGWAWTPLSGGVPDADDTAAAMIALTLLGHQEQSTYELGCKWLLHLQNSDGGIPTFCHGWGRLPFDKSCPDLSAHAYRAFELTLPFVSEAFKIELLTSQKKIINYLKHVQTDEGAFLPLWFGNQYSDDQSAPIYGTSVVLDHCRNIQAPFIQKALEYLKKNQKIDGSWDGQFLFTLKATAALALFPGNQLEISRACVYITEHVKDPTSITLEPIGLYFAQLWYSEVAYAPIFLVQTLNHLNYDA